MTLTVERMARATREDCLEAVLRVMPVVVEANKHLKHREALSDPDFLRERLSALPPEDFEDISSADRYAVNGQLYAWNREAGVSLASYSLRRACVICMSAPHATSRNPTPHREEHVGHEEQ